MRKERVDEYGTIIHEFDWAALLEEVQSPPKAKGYDRGGKRSLHGSTGTQDPAWYGTRTYPDALDHVLHGWQDGAKRIGPLAAKLLQRVGAHLQRLNFVNVPDEPGVLDLGAFLAGVPECWTNPETEVIAAQGRLIHLLVNGSASSSRDAEQIWAHGAAVCAMIRCLEMAGHSVRVTWATVAAGSGRRGRTRKTVISATAIRVKDFGEPLNLGRMAFVLASPGMLRRVWFRLAERFKYAERRALDVELNGCYGFPQRLDAWKTRPKADLVVDLLFDGRPAEVEAHVLKDLDKAGVLLRRKGG